MISTLVFLDMFGLVFGVSGALLVGNLNRKGFLCFTAGSLSHGTMGFMQGNFGLMLSCMVFICIDIFYYRKWGQRDLG